MGASTAAKDRGGSRDDSQTGKFTGGSQTGKSDPDAGKKIAKKVKEKLGLTTVPNTPPPGQEWGKWDSPTSTVAMNLKGKDKWMYGQEASQLTNEEMVKAGLATKGNPYYDHKGNITGHSYFLTSSGKEIKYGKSDGAMGSGDPTGAMTSVPISSKMLQQQNKMKTIIQGAIGLITPAPVSTIAKLGMAKSSADLLQPGAAYDDYTKKFQAKQAGKKFTSTRNIMGILGLTGHKKKTLGE